MSITYPPVGSKVIITTTDKTYEGILLPTESTYCVVKLISGYNLGINPDTIQNIEVLNKPKKADVIQTTTLPDTTLPAVRVIHTGGTIASRVDYKTGGVVADFDAQALLALFPELTKLVQLESEFIGNMFSEDLRFTHINLILKAIEKAVKEGTKSIIVTTGTDFLHYISAGLSYACKDIDASILVVGSQRSSDRGSSDAALNLCSAAKFLTQTDFTGVGVCMHATSSDNDCVVLPGINVRKMHSSRRDAFKAINTTPLATVSKETITIHRQLSNEGKKGHIHYFDDTLKIGICYAHPNMYVEELLPYKKFDALIIAGSGLGHLAVGTPDESTKEHATILLELKKLAELIPVVMTTQTIHGGVHLQVYSSGRTLSKIGILGHMNLLTAESSFMKIAHLLSIQADVAKEFGCVTTFEPSTEHYGDFNNEY